MGLLGRADRLISLAIGHYDREGVLRHFASPSAENPAGTPFTERDWNPDLCQRLVDYCSGMAVGFDDIPLCYDRQTPFQQRVVQATRAIPYGETRSYGQIAEAARAPRAARAVGSVMSNNPFPLIVPCHRVVASGGGLGGYTSHRGTSFKQILLDMEAEVAGANSGLDRIHGSPT
jgi:methylated-DNA-[protein]-cysteine S-methyltransferase